MNERIYELAKQAELIEFESISGSDADTPNYESVVRAKKFAELIVRECCDVLFDNELGGYQVNYVLKEHFGVDR